MPEKAKPKLGLVSGEETLDLESLRQMYINLTGREPTEKEMEDAKRKLKEANQQGH